MTNPSAWDLRKSLAGARDPSAPASSRPASARREQQRLPETLSRHLSAYALAAGAAGVGLLALAPATKADIVYTRTNIPIASGPAPGPLTGIDLNGDGINDLSFRHWIQTNPAYPFKSFEYAFVPPSARGPKGVMLGPLASGSQIGPGGNFGTGGLIKGFVLYPLWNGGAWATSLGGFRGEGFLGLEFSIDGQARYGWVQLQLVIPLVSTRHPSFVFTDTVTGYAYETNPNQPIGAGQTSESPEPGTLGLLALGSLGLDYWRRRRHAS